MKKNIYLSLLLIVAFISCKKEHVNHSPLAAIEFFDKIDKIELHGEKSVDPDNDLLGYKWTTESDLVTIVNSDQSVAYFDIPQLSEPETIKVTLIISDGHFKDSANAVITILANNNIRTWGLGNNLKNEFSNNKDYEWYLDQMNTGTYANVNCGPTSTTMAIKWFNKDFTKTPQDARNTFRSGGGWWYTSDIINYLNDNNVNNKTIKLDSINVLKAEINKGNIVILCLDMYYITYNAMSEVRKDKFYTTGNTGWGHFIVVKGYKEVDDQILYEVYDPNSYGKRYVDNSLKGKDRYYKSSELDIATNIWWDYAIVISNNPLKGASVDINSIKHMPGR